MHAEVVLDLRLGYEYLHFDSRRGPRAGTRTSCRCLSETGMFSILPPSWAELRAVAVSILWWRLKTLGYFARAISQRAEQTVPSLTPVCATDPATAMALAPGGTVFLPGSALAGMRPCLHMVPPPRALASEMPHAPAFLRTGKGGLSSR
jgi:hypothetical protein